MSSPATKGAVKASAPAAPAKQVEPAAEKAKKVKVAKPVYKQLFDSEAELIAEVGKRDKGPRRMFKVSLNGKDYWVAATNQHRAPEVPWAALGGSVNELGKKARSTKISADALLASLDFQSADELERIQAQLAKLVALRKSQS